MLDLSGRSRSVECCSIIAHSRMRLIINWDTIWESIPMETMTVDLGTDKLRKYAAMYGLDRKSGVEILEAALADI